MAINTALLVAAPMLQDYFVDKDTGLPLAGGLVSFYQDNSRTTFKNVYYQTGVPGNYTYIPLPNPMTLTAVGTIADAMGNDVIPFFYPYSETDNVTPQPYYITVDSFEGERQFTRENFPFLPNRASTSNIPTLKNYIVNNVFWRNIGGATLTNNLFATIAPSNHDGFTNPDIYFSKNIIGGVDILDFFKFPQGDPANNSLPGAITPEFYLNLKCTSATVGETSKYISYPISLHVKTLENARATFTIWARTEGGSSANEITIELYQFLGTATVSPVLTLQTLTINQNWTRYTIPFIFPSSSGLTLSNAGDDAFYIFIQHPLDTEFNISHALPSLYLGNILPSEQFTTYDEVDSIVNTPRTGDIRTSLNSFYPFGWLPLNDGTIGAANSNSTTRENIDTWQLYNLIWSYFFDPANQFLAPMYTPGGSLVAYGASPYADFSSGNSITLTRTLGRVIAGAVPAVPILPWTLSGAPPTSILNISSTSNFNLGVPVTVYSNLIFLPSPLQEGIFYYMIPLSSTTFSLATTFENALNNIPIVLTTSGVGTFFIQLNASVGAYFGSQNHSMTIAQMPAHDHEPGSSLVNVALEGMQAGGGGTTFSTLTFQPGSGMDFPVFVNTQGNGQPFSLYQPTAWYNMFIKL